MSTERVQSYATAFFEAALDRWTATMDGVAAALAQAPQISARLAASDVDFAARQRLLDSLLPADADLPVRNLLYTLAQHDELGELADIAAALRERARRAEAGPTPVDVVSAIALTPEQQYALVSRLEAQYGSNLVFSYRVDPAILGGLIVRVGDKLLDGSVASKLAAMKQSLGVVSAA